MIAYDYNQALEASFYKDIFISYKTNKELTYTYYCELCKKYRDRSMDDLEYLDWEILMLKYDLNRKEKILII